MEELPTTQVRMGRLTSLLEHDRSFDVEFWQAHTTTERWEAAQELIEHYLLRKGLNGDALRLQRNVARLKRPGR